MHPVFTLTELFDLVSGDNRDVLALKKVGKTRIITVRRFLESFQHRIGYNRYTVLNLRYSVVRQSLGEPDTFRIRYRTQIADTVKDIVCRQMDKKSVVTLIRQYAAANISQHDQARFMEIVETEVMSLHESNIARYKLRPSQFKQWQETWR